MFDKLQFVVVVDSFAVVRRHIVDNESLSDNWPDLD